jgi:hypothetical protein
MGCAIDPNNFEQYIERTQDSSRYFVIRVLSPTGGTAQVGLGFVERNDAFDFWACLIDYKDTICSENSAVEVTDTSNEPNLDHLRLNPGQTFSISGSSASPSSGDPAPKPIRKLAPPPRK